MIVKPVLIVGAPRSGTSLLQKIFRGHPAFWSLPSESEIIWDPHCHPRLRGWESDCLGPQDLTQKARADILERFESFIAPAWAWRTLEKLNLIWTFKRSPASRSAMSQVYQKWMPRLTLPARLVPRKRLVEKTISNCLRLEYVMEVFPDARIIYPVRDGRNNVSSIINAWLNPSRFFSYDLPVDLDMPGYPFKRWNFALPPGWQDFTRRPLEEVCAFQWTSCHQIMQQAISAADLDDRVLRIKLEDLAAEPGRHLRLLADFIGLPFDGYFRDLARALPVINSPDGNTSADKWRHQNQERIQKILPQIQPMMELLGYEA